MGSKAFWSCALLPATARSKPHYTSRSAVETDDVCPRKRFLSTCLNGIGVEPNDHAEALIIGTAIHTGPEILWTTASLDQALSAIKSMPEHAQLSDMWRFWLECILRAYYRVRYLPQSRDWSLLEAEKEVTYKLGTSPKGRELFLLAKPDLMLQHKLTGFIRYKEFKSTATMSDRFLESWRKAVQLAAGELGYATRGIKVDQVQVAFFCKGEKADGYWRTPFLSAWRTVDGLLYKGSRPKSWKGWERFDVWQSGFTPEQWLTKLTDDELSEELPETPELVFDPHIRDNWAAQTFYREADIADAVSELADLDELYTDRVNCSHDIRADYLKRRQRILNRYFPQRFRNCRPSTGPPCVFETICFNPTIEANPLASGLYRPRQPHHETEARALAGED